MNTTVAAAKTGAINNHITSGALQATRLVRLQFA
jgi:hypothetical protein